MTNAFEAMLVSMINANKASLREIAKCNSMEEAKPMADSLVARDGLDAAEGFLRMGLISPCRLGMSFTITLIGK